jgi:hypothetical protein
MAGKDLRWQPDTVLLSQISPKINHLKYAVLVVLEDSKALAVDGDHVFLLNTGQLITADRLTKKDILTSPAGDPVPIKSVHAGAYFARFQIVITNQFPVDDNLSNHFIITNGVVSGDYALALLFHDNTLAPHLAEEFNNRPVIGSDEYLEIYGPASIDFPEGQIGYIKIKHGMPDDNEADVFVPAAHRLIKVPENAHCFSDSSDPILVQKRDSFSLSDKLAQQEADDVLRLYRKFYPDIKFCLEWNVKEVNACAWRDGGERHVSINGGVARLLVIESEGFALFLAHEVGHHTGGRPIFPDGLSCEGESDYEGTLTILRNIWGSDYATRIEKAIGQMALYYDVANSANPPDGSANCGHPTRECRIATYHAGKAPRDKPSCAV